MSFSLPFTTPWIECTQFDRTSSVHVLPSIFTLSFIPCPAFLNICHSYKQDVHFIAATLNTAFHHRLLIPLRDTCDEASTQLQQALLLVLLRRGSGRKLRRQTHNLNHVNPPQDGSPLNLTSHLRRRVPPRLWVRGPNHQHICKERIPMDKSWKRLITHIRSRSHQ